MQTQAKKNTFILNSDYLEQVAMLSDVQAGQLFRVILQYANTQQTDAIADPVVEVMFAFIRQQMDKNSKKYEETCKKRAENGKKGGRPTKNSVNTEAQEPPVEEANGTEKAEKANGFFEKQTKAKKANGFFEKQTKAKKADNEYEYDYDYEYDNEYEYEYEYEYDNIIKPSGGGGVGEEDARVRELIHKNAQTNTNAVDNMHNAVDNMYNAVDNAPMEAIAYMLEDRYPLTRTAYNAFAVLTEELWQHYAQKQPSQYDIAQVVGYTYRREERSDGTAIAVPDADKVDLLRYVFRQAADADKVNWRYIDGIYANLRQRGITCVADAYADNMVHYH